MSTDPDYEILSFCLAIVFTGMMFGAIALFMYRSVGVVHSRSRFY